MNPDQLNPDDVLSQLGLQTNEFAPGEGYQSPTSDPTTGLPQDFTRPGEAPQGQRNGVLEQARVLAQLQGKPNSLTGTDRFAAGLGAKLGKAPSHPAIAALDGGISGFAEAYKAGKDKKGGLSDIKERMGLLKTLFDMDRTLARDKAADGFRERALTATEQRTKAYLERQVDPKTGRPRAGKTIDPLVREKRILDIMAKDPTQVILDNDDAIRPGRRGKMTAEQRAAAEAKRDARRKQLEEMTPYTEGGDPAEAATEEAPQDPNRFALDPNDPRAQRRPATPSPAENPPPVDSANPNVNVVPNPGLDPAIPAPAPQSKAPAAPRLTREQIIEQGRAANQNGAPLEAIIGRAKERGFDLTPDDFAAPPPQQQGGGSMNPLSILQSLFGG